MTKPKTDLDLSPQTKREGRTETPLLPAPGKNTGAPDTGTDPQGPNPSSLYARWDVGKFFDLPGGADR